MSRLLFAAPGKFQPPVTQRHLEAEVPHCVGGVLSPPWQIVWLAVTNDRTAAQQRVAGVPFCGVPELGYGC
jgi:hypothetical protein